jgi:ATP-dependent protease HslVU (ClpYQ) peptidase subunit
MTFHVALASAPGAVMVSDSQGSTAVAEAHGLQKQFVGDDYLLGLAGHMGVINALLRELATGVRINGGVPPAAVDVERVVTGFMTAEVRPSALGSIEALLVVPEGTGHVVKTFYPGLFTRFGDGAPMGMIGSGAEFAQRAAQRDQQLGLANVGNELADLFLRAESFANVANESLTVDDQLLVGFLANGRSYLCGHAGVRAALVPAAVQAEWIAVAQAFGDLINLSQALRSELQTAQRLFSLIRLGPLSPPAQHQIDQSAVGIQSTRMLLVQRLADYCAWYDSVLGR